MRRALRLARAVAGRTSPNPAVGCVIVRGRGIVGAGATAAGGRPHAEALALRAAGARARKATAYVTFEPCAHRGKTPSCARALAAAGVSRVVVGCVDPYPPVRGRGILILRRAGIEVTAGVLERECRRINEGFIARVVRRRPMVILKLAMSLDGRIATASGDSRWISSPRARALVHRWRGECDAVMVGAGTILADNPRLTCRIAGGRDPARVIIDARLRTPPDSLVYRARSTAPAILVTTRANLSRARRRYASPGVEVIAAPARAGAIDLKRLMSGFARRGWNKVMIEGGAHLAGAALAAAVVDRLDLFVAPKLVGAGLGAVVGLAPRLMRDSIALSNLAVRRVGADLLIEAVPLARRRRRR
jgi:diaminohydroxyphosphoribosylaminopyrimidine deaminase / 5-amino-6-(5-phosphoribosylamino)uracil reductase